ncbi:PEP-CTERM sorting domain-containing protein [Prosthecobacter sp.]|jgi:MYXO-CTERM domain-containing protein|uniref:PEP-CTERM sorting domain-containing protein n=1 Tax=Prosthecobacter sp. TaxID=1965333 RepID=UPI0037C6B9E3
MKNKLLSLTLAIAFISSVQAATTLQFSVSPDGATNFANASGTATNGMLWGVVIATSASFSSGSYDTFNPSVSGFLNSGGVATTDYYFATGLSTQALTSPFFTGNEAGNGGITTAFGVPTTGDGVSGVDAGDKFGLLWLPTSTAATNDNYGFYTNAAFTLQSSASVVNYSSVFAGADPIRSASFTVGASAVPEPSRAILAVLGLGLITLRRRR